MKNLIRKILSFSILFIINSNNLSRAMDDAGSSSKSSAKWVLDDDLREHLGLHLPSPSSRKRSSEEELEKAPYTAMDVANYFLAHDFSRRSAKERGEPGKEGQDIDPLKLQKLLYYAQGYYLAFNGRPLFDEDFVAWQHGPVLKGVYHTFKHFGDSSINSLSCGLESGQKSLPDLVKEAWAKIHVDNRPYLRTVYRTYCRLSGWQLRNKTHGERPWIKTDGNNIIEKVLLRDFFQGPPFLEFLTRGIEEKFLRENFLNLINKIRLSNIFDSSQDRMEEYRNSLDDLKNRLASSPLITTFFKEHMDTFDQFTDQSFEEAILGSFFFPDILEMGFDPESVYFQHRTIPTLLSFSAHFNSPIAIFYLSKMLRDLGYEAMEETLRKKAKHIFEASVAENRRENPEANLSILGTSFFYLAEIDKQEGEWSDAEEKLSRAVELLLEHGNTKRLFQVARGTNDLELKEKSAVKADDPDSNIVLATMEKYKDQRSKLLQDSIKKGSAQACYTFGGLMIEENPSSIEAIVLLREAIRRGSYGAALYLAEKEPSNALEAYDIAFQCGFQSAYYHKYLYLIARNRLEEAKTALLQSGLVLIDGELSGVFPEDKQEEIKLSIFDYMKELVTTTGSEFIEDQEDSASDSSSLSIEEQDIPSEEE